MKEQRNNPGGAGRCDEPADVYDATRHDNITELPALTTRMDGDQFREWIAAEGQIFIVYLPMRKSFIIKVPEQQHAFFVDMMKQLRMTLGPDVQAASAQAVDLGPQPRLTGDDLPWIKLEDKGQARPGTLALTRTNPEPWPDIGTDIYADSEDDQ